MDCYNITDSHSLPEITQSTLFVYKRSTIACFEQRHDIIDVLATYQSIDDSTVKLPVQYCKSCDKLLIGEKEFERHQSKALYRFIPTRIKIINESESYCPTDNPFMNLRSKESPLMLCGYSVNAKYAIPRNVRQDILCFIIERGILSRLDVINYLELFISTNGMRSSMEPSVQKWKDDLHFVYMYDFNIEATAHVAHISPYRR